MAKQTLKNLSPKPKRQWLYYSVSIATLILLWLILSETVYKKNALVPTPYEVFLALGEIIKKGRLAKAAANTFLRSLVCFLFSFAMGFAFSIIASLFPKIQAFLAPIITLMRSIPALAISVLLLMWFSSKTASIYIGFFVIFPIIYASLLAAIQNVDKKLLEMARIYRIPLHKRLLSIYLPSIVPYIFAASIAGFSLNIKVVIAAEIIGMPLNSIGNWMTAARFGLDYPMMFAWCLVAVIICFLSEAVLRFFEKLCCPHKFSTQKRIAGIFRKAKKFFNRKPMQSAKQNSDKIESTNNQASGLPKNNICLKNIGFSYPNQDVLQDFSLEIPHGKITCILGASGSGKTTILNLLAGSLAIQSGEIENKPDSVSYVFQESRLIPQLSVYSNLALILSAQNDEKKRLIHKALTKVKLEDEQEKYPHQLSGGMAQRVALSRAFLSLSNTILLDEPFKGLDYKMKNKLFDVFLDLFDPLSDTAIMVTHDIDDACMLGDEIVVLSDKPPKALGRFSINTPHKNRKAYSDEIVSIKSTIYKLIE